jgi:uncharacterized protein YciI
VQYFALIYDVIDDYVEQRAQFRQLHLALAEDATRRGQLVLGGAFDDPVDGALLVFKGADRSVAEDFARSDPYVLNGLVTHWRVRPWNVVIGTAHES